MISLDFRSALLAIDLPTTRAMTRHLFAVFLIGVLAPPALAHAQHSRGADTPSVGTAVSSAPSAPSSAAPAPSQPATSSSGGSTSDSGRRRGDLPQTGTAVPRSPVPGNGNGRGTIPYGGFYPWGYAYDGAVVAGYGEYYGGYFGAYDPWYGWSPAYAPIASASDYAGALRLKVKPADASVYVDGYYVGVVDDYDGIFQRLRLDAGPHRIEMHAPEHHTLSVDVMIQPDLTITYRGQLEKRP
jgi:hypothetical protein